MSDAMRIRVNPLDGAEMIWIPSGEFLMGSIEDEIRQFEQSSSLYSGNRHDECPQHRVWLDGYWIYRYEVTVAQYRLYCEKTGYAYNWDYTPWGGWVDSHPIEVDWFQAFAYAQWTGAQLPSEAQWEKAARGTDGRRFPWGDNVEPGRWADLYQPHEGYVGNAFPVDAHPLGASPYGVMDMVGNTWEWCCDWYAADYYMHSPYRNPTGPSTGEYKVSRGSMHCSYHLEQCIIIGCANRGSTPQENPYNGFRCVVPSLK